MNKSIKILTDVTDKSFALIVGETHVFDELPTQENMDKLYQCQNRHSATSAPCRNCTEVPMDKDWREEIEENAIDCGLTIRGTVGRAIYLTEKRYERLLAQEREKTLEEVRNEIDNLLSQETKVVTDMGVIVTRQLVYKDNVSTLIDSLKAK